MKWLAFQLHAEFDNHYLSLAFLNAQYFAATGRADPESHDSKEIDELFFSSPKNNKLFEFINILYVSNDQPPKKTHP
jgi:hypothetical protein